MRTLQLTWLARLYSDSAELSVEVYSALVIAGFTTNIWQTCVNVIVFQLFAKQAGAEVRQAQGKLDCLNLI